MTFKGHLRYYKPVCENTPVFSKVAKHIVKNFSCLVAASTYRPSFIRSNRVLKLRSGRPWQGIRCERGTEIWRTVKRFKVLATLDRLAVYKHHSPSPIYLKQLKRRWPPSLRHNWQNGRDTSFRFTVTANGCVTNDNDRLVSQTLFFIKRRSIHLRKRKLTSKTYISIFNRPIHSPLLIAMAATKNRT